MKHLVLYILTAIWLPAAAQLKVSPDKRYLHTSTGKPFFWLGDTAWELFHKLDRREADRYLRDRASKGFTVIQAVVLAELDGLSTPNPYGDTPLIDNDPAKPNESYFKHVDYVVQRAESLGLIVAMLPSWGDKWNKAWGQGPEIFTPQNAKAFGEYLGRRYRKYPIVWVLGGDRHIENAEDRHIIHAMAEGLKSGDGGRHLITFHPTGARSSYDYFKDATWIDFHMSQTGHSQDSRNYRFNRRNLSPVLPHLDGEPRYEDHPNKFKPGEFGWMDDFDARQTAYWSMLSGACGHTYGNHNIWQFYNGSKPVSWARTHWTVALDQPGARQMGFMRRFFEQYNWQSLQPNQSAIGKDNPETPEYEVAATSADGRLLIAYLPYGRKTTINTSMLKTVKLKLSLFNPRDAQILPLGEFKNEGSKSIVPPSEGRGSDWVVVVEGL
ncbi:glycoside hydrolase family 140 protein [Pedobacter deserti]|uniref:glycoside hydrolase family 140 protein n=1 Tax=Pedobacter deserti TaxID=2817382 RepID=UPI00210E48E5|nr:glycoside hydrolase family 140 protein [Pedobacter sp. SYSU D00382]